jgi:hypothetical protein
MKLFPNYSVGMRSLERDGGLFLFEFLTGGSHSMVEFTLLFLKAKYFAHTVIYSIHTGEQSMCAERGLRASS